MLAHATDFAARLHDALVFGCLEQGRLDLHALATTRAQLYRAAGMLPPAASRSPWALRHLSPACFAAERLVIGPPPRADEATSAATLRLEATLPAALHLIDALVALVGARVMPQPADALDAAPAAWGHLSRHERTTLSAALAAPRWPSVTLSSQFAPAAAYERGKGRGQAAIEALGAMPVPAAAGPLFLWLGPRTFTDLLSPYVHDVGDALLAAAPATIARVSGAEAALPGNPYALAEQAARLSAEVAKERAMAEATVGIHALASDDMEAEWIDCAQLDVDACAPGIQSLAHKARAQGAQVLRCPYERARPQAPAWAAAGHEAAGLIDALTQHHAIAGVAMCVPPAAPVPHDVQLWWREAETDAPAEPEAASDALPPQRIHADADLAAALRAARRALVAPHAVFLGAPGTAPTTPGAQLVHQALQRWTTSVTARTAHGADGRR